MPACFVFSYRVGLQMTDGWAPLLFRIQLHLVGVMVKEIGDQIVGHVGIAHVES